MSHGKKNEFPKRNVGIGMLTTMGNKVKQRFRYEPFLNTTPTDLEAWNVASPSFAWWLEYLSQHLVWNICPYFSSGTDQLQSLSRLVFHPWKRTNEKCCATKASGIELNFYVTIPHPKVLRGLFHHISMILQPCAFWRWNKWKRSGCKPMLVRKGLLEDLVSKTLPAVWHLQPRK